MDDQAATRMLPVINRREEIGTISGDEREVQLSSELVKDLFVRSPIIERLVSGTKEEAGRTVVKLLEMTNAGGH